MKNMYLGYYSFFVYKPFQDKHCIEFDLDENQGVRENGIHCISHYISKNVQNRFGLVVFVY